MGSSATSDILTGLDAIATFNVQAANVQYISTNTLTITAVETLTGGNADDTLSFASFSTARDIRVDAVGTVDGFDITETSLSGIIFKNINTLLGSTSTADELTGLDAVAIWDVNAKDSGTYTMGHSMDFSGIENLVGGSVSDLLAWTSYASGRSVVLTALGSEDGFDGAEVSLAGSGPSLTGGFFNFNILIGSATTDDTLTGANLPASWNITGVVNQYTVNPTLLFTGFENLVGGTDVDTFTMQPGAVLVGDLNGGGGVDLLTYALYPTGSSVSVDLAAGTATAIGGMVSNIENLTGGADDDTLSGDAANNILTGGLGDDDLTGRGGNDIYVFADGWGSDTIVENVGEGLDTLDFSAVTFSLTGDINAAITISGSGNQAVHNGNHIEVVIGGSAADTFTITGARPVSLLGIGGADTFIFNDTATLTMGARIDGGAGTDTLDYRTYTDPRSWVLVGLGTVDGFMGTEASIAGGFDNINTIWAKARAAPDNGTDSLTGLDAAATWNINAGGLVYTSGGRTLDFTNIENLVGGDDDDTFVFANGAELPGDFNSIAGRARTDTLDYSAYTTPVEVYLQGGRATGTTGGVSSIENVVGSVLAGNIIHGDDNDNVFTSGSTNDTMVGYGGNDTYIFDTDSALGVDVIDEQTGGGGVDTLDFSGTTTLAVVIDISTGAQQVVNANLTLTILGTTENVIGGSVGDSITGNAQANEITGGPGNDQINGGAGNDTYFFADGWGSDTLNDDGGTDALDFSAVTTTLTFNLQPAAFNISDTTNAVSHAGSAFDTFIGGTNDDVFNLADSTSLTGYVDGQGGANTLNLSAFSTARTTLLTGYGAQVGFDGTDTTIPNGFKNITTLNASTSSAADHLTGLNEISQWGIDGTNTYSAGGRTLNFANYEKLTGGSAADTFTLTGTQAHTILAGADDDTLAFNDNAVLTGSFDGQSDHDTVDMSAYTSARQVALTGLGSTDGFTGTINGITSGFTNLDAIIGSSTATDDHITGRDADAFWSVDGTNQYTAIQSLTLTGNETDYAAKKAIVQGRTALLTNGSPVVLDFAGFETLQGGSQNDLFEFGGAQTHSVLGGDDEDYFAFNAGATYTGTIDGESGRNTLDYNAGSGGSYATPVALTLSGLGTANGFAGTASNITGSFDNIVEIAAGGAVDSLAGLDVASTWNIEVYPTFSRYTGSARTLNFALVDTLLGGSAADTFDMADNATLTGLVDGNAGDDTLNFNAYSSVRNFALTALGTTDGFDGTVNGITAGFADINIITGGTALDTLTGLNADSHWAINAANSGIYTSTNSLSFGAVDTLIGNAAADRFDFAVGATLSGLVNGGSGTDELDYADFNTSVTVDLSTGLATGVNGNNVSGVSNVENITGGTAADSLMGNAGANVITGNAGNDTLTGLGGDDRYVFGDNANTDNVFEAASAGNDTLDFSPATVDLRFAISSVHVTGTGIDVTHAADNIENVIGGTGKDTLDYSIFTTDRDIILTGLGRDDGFAGRETGTGISFDNIDSIIGSTSTSDVLTGLDALSTFNVQPSTIEYISTNTLTITGVEMLIGGNANDILTFADFSTARDIQVSAVGTVDGFDITEASVTGIFKNINTLVGSTSTSDILKGLNAVSTFNVQPAKVQYVSTNTLTITDVETLKGGNANDTLSFAVFSTARDIQISAVGTVDGFDITENSFSGTFKNINTLIGSTATTDALTGLNAVATFNVQAANLQYISTNILTISDIETLKGGTDADTFNIVGTRTESLEGGSGDDSFVFADGATISTAIHGGGGSDTLDYSGYTTAVTVNLATGDLGGGVGTVTGIENITGGLGDDKLTGDASNNVLTGGPGVDTLAGSLGDDTYRFASGWGVDNPIIENLNEGVDTFDFSAITIPLTATLASITVTDGISTAQHTGTHIENLIGGSAGDTFRFANGATLNGKIDGQAGSDTLDLSAYTTGLNVRITSVGSVDGLAGSIDNVLGSFDNINALTTGSGSDTLFGMNADATWTIDTTNSYASGGSSMTFSGVENLSGGSGADTFKLVGTASVSGNVAGGLGIGDTLDYSAYTAAALVNFPAGTATGVGGSVSAIEQVISNGIGVTLDGDENDNTLVGGLGNDTLRGHGGNDTLIGNGGDDYLDGGAGLDTAVYSGSANGVVVDLGAGTAQDQGVGTSSGTDILVSIENVIGSDYTDVITGDAGDNILTGGAGDDTLSGLGGDDTYKFGDNAGIDTINELAAGGTDTLDFSAATVNLQVTAGSLQVSGTGIAVSSGGMMENYIGGQGVDTLDFSAQSTAQWVTLSGLGSVDGFAGTSSGLVGTFDNLNALTGGTSTADVLEGLDAVARFNLQPAASQYISTNTLSFSAFETLNGGSQADTFDIAGAVAYTLNGHAGDDTLHFTEGAALTGSFDGGSGLDTLSFSGNTSARTIALTGLGSVDGFAGNAAGGTFDNVNTLVGGNATTDALTGLDAVATFNIQLSAVNYVSTNTLAISGIEALSGGSQADTFIFADGATLESGAGTLNGAGGLNTLDYSVYTTSVSVDLGAGTATGTAGVTNVADVIGGQAGDALTGYAGANTLIGGPGDDTLSGAAGNDTYIFKDGAGTDTVVENAGGGTDTLDFSAVTNALTFSPAAYTVADTTLNMTYSAYVENLIGGTGVDTISYAGDGAAHSVTLTGTGSGDGFAGVATSLPGTFDNMNAFVGGSGSDTLNALNASNTWTLDGANSQYANGGRVFGFDPSVEILSGGTDVDTFELVGAENGTLNAGAGADTVHFGEGATLNGHFNGGPGADTLSFNGNTTGRGIVLTGLGSADGFSGTAAGGTFDNVNTLTGGNGADSMTGLDAVATFNIQSSTVEYISTNTLTITGIEDLIGGSHADTFTLADGASFSGSVDGQSGTNRLDFSAFTTGRNIVLTGTGSTTGFNGTEASLTGGFANITTLTGSIAADTLTGPNLAATWQFDSLGSSLQQSTSTLAFADFETLIGGTADDTFELIGTVSVSSALNGGAHSLGDTLDYSTYTGNVTVNLATGQATGTNGISNIEIIKGGTGTNTITGDSGSNTLYGGPSNDRLVGGTGDDTYILFDGWGTDEIVELPGEGTDTIDLSGITGATGTLAFNFGSGTLTITGGGNSVTHTGGNVENFVGGNFDNNFVFGAGVTIAGGVTGGTGTDTLNFSAYTTALNAVLTGLGTADGFAGSVNGIPFDNVDALLGGTASDSLSGANLVSQWGLDGTPDYDAGGRVLEFSSFETLTGSDQADTFTLTGAQSFALNSGAGDDIFVLSNAASLTGSINGGVGADTLDYSAYTTSVTVDLSASAAQGITGAVSGVENVTGGDANDTLTGDAGSNMLRGGSGADIISGLGGDDILVGGADNDTLNGGAGNDIFRFELNAWGVDGINELAGEGDDTMDFSPLSDDLDIVLGSVTVTNGANKTTHAGNFIENVTGGSRNDTFTVTGAQVVDLDGGPGDDTFIFDDSATLTGTVSGSVGTDTLSFAPYSSGRNIGLTGLGSADGFVGTATGLTGSFTNINALVGSAATSDMLTGMNAVSTFNLQPANLQYISTNALTFSGFETLLGGSAADTFEISGTQTFDLLGGAGDDRFAFADNSQLRGSIDGQGGMDEIDFSSYTTARRIVLTGLGSQNGFAGGDYTPVRALTGGFDNFNAIVGSSDPSGGDVIVGINMPGEWGCGAVCTYTANPTLTFAGFETLVGGDADDKFTISGTRDLTLVGGAGDDTFVMGSGAGITGSINGQGGNDTIEYDLTAIPPHNASAGTTTDVGGGIFSIEYFTLTPQPPLITTTHPPLPPLITTTQQTLGGLELVDIAVELEAVQLQLYTPVYVMITLITLVRPGEPVLLQPHLINILVIDHFAQVMVAPESGEVAEIVVGTEDNLPSVLPTRYQFMSSLKVSIFDERGVAVEALPFGTWLNLSFALPEDYAGYTFVLLYWDETLNGGLGGWVEIPVEIMVRGALGDANMADLLSYFRYWDGDVGEWVTVVEALTFWDGRLASSLGGWVEIPALSTSPKAVASVQVNFTGTFILVAAQP